jgi:hypothetical protein
VVKFQKSRLAKSIGYDLFRSSIKQQSYVKLLLAILLYLLASYFKKSKVESKTIKLKKGQSVSIIHKAN